VKNLLQVDSELARIEKQITFDTMRRYSGTPESILRKTPARSRASVGTGTGWAACRLPEPDDDDNFGKYYLTGGEISVSFIKPVRPGDVVHGRGVVREIHPIGASNRWCVSLAREPRWEKTTVGTASAVIDPRVEREQ